MKQLWHRLLAKLLELLLTGEFVTVLSELPATSNPPLIDILLLRRHSAQWTERQRALLPDGVRDRQVAHHLLECKITESVTDQSLQQALTYDYLYRQSQQLAADQVQTYVVSAHTPQADRLADWGYTVVEQPGVYLSTSPLVNRIVLLVLNDLRDAPHNDYFRLFASRRRVRQRALGRLTREQAPSIWAVVFALQKAYELEGEGMGAELTLETLLEMGEEVRKHVVASASLEERLAGLAPEERLVGLAPEDVEHFLAQNTALRQEVVAHAPPEERLLGLGPEELVALMKQIESSLQAQSTKATPLAEKR